MTWEGFGRVFEYLMVAAVLVGPWLWQRRAARRKPDTRSDIEKLIGTPVAAPPPPALTPECRWGKDRTDASQARWVCATCNAETCLPGDGRPGSCLRQESRLRDKH